MNSLLEKLDKVEQLEPDAVDAEEVLALLEQVAAHPRGLQILVERYSSSSSAIIVRSLSFLLAVAAASPTLETYPLIFSFIERLKNADDESTLINCLTALQRQLIHDFSWDPPSLPPPMLYPFFMHCLNQSVFVQRGAIAVLSLLYEEGLMDTFDPAQIALLRRRLVEISMQHDVLLDRELESLSTFLREL